MCKFDVSPVARRRKKTSHACNDLLVGFRVTSLLEPVPAVSAVSFALTFSGGGFWVPRIQYDGLQLGYELGHRFMTQPASYWWPAAETVFSVCRTTFLIIFSAEILVRICFLRVASSGEATNSGEWMGMVGNG
eukprot:Skav206807  [mRNA]  locus=scaffold1990:287598:290091:- [translate_table: standard]